MFSLRGSFSRRARQQIDPAPSYYLINPKPELPRITLSRLKLVAGVVTGSIGLLGVGNQLYEGWKKPSVDVELHQKYSGFEIRAVNRGDATATQVSVDLASWLQGSPGYWTQTYHVRDLPPRSETSVHIELVPESLPEESRVKMIEQMDKLATSGYVMVSCRSCPRARIWAFGVPGWNTPQDISRNRKTTQWPLIELPGIDQKPPTGFCVDYPAGSCEKRFAWSPVDN